LVILALSVTLSINLILPEPLLLSPSNIKFKSPVSLLTISNVFASFPNLRIPVLFSAPTEYPMLTFGTPLSDITSTDVFDSFLIVTSELGIADPTPTLPVLSAVSAVPPVPTFNSVDAVVIPEFTSPVTSPVRFPVTLPVTFPVNAPTKLVDVVTPLTDKPVELLVKAAPTAKAVAVTLARVDIPVELIFPSTLPVIFPVTLPVRLPVTFPTTSPVTGPAIAPTKLEAVIIPVAFILPIELIPTPYLPATSGDPPTWKLCNGSVVAIPTLPCAYIDVNAKPVLISVHCEVGKFDKVAPSP